MSTVPQEFQGGGNPNSSVTQSGADSTPPAQLFGDEDLFSVFQLYPAITEGKFYRTDNKLLKHTIERYTADIAGPEIETTLGRDGLPMPGALPVDATKLLPVLVPPAPFEVYPIRPELHQVALTFPPGPPLDVAQSVKKKGKDKDRKQLR